MEYIKWTKKKVQKYGLLCATLGIAVGILGTIFIEKIMQLQ
jgi:hypothetical protein